MAEARRASKRALAHLADFGTSRIVIGPATTTAEMVSDSLRGSSTPQDRAQRTLKLLCDDRAATIGYLYLVADAGLTLVASQGSPAPPEGLLEYRGRVPRAGALGERRPDRRVRRVADLSSALHARPCFRDGAGVEHRLVL